MTELKNDRFIRALLRQPVDKTPVWIMRQAGRYLPEYRATRQKAGNFLNLCKTPELACEVTLQPLKRFDLDAAILFSDILTIPDAMGLGLFFTEGEGPQFKNPIRTEKDIKNLHVPDPETELKYVMDTVRLLKYELDGSVPLIGFSGSPWTLACYMIQGGGSKDFNIAKSLMFREPKLMQQLLSVITQSVLAYLDAQIEAGAQTVMLFDTWGGLLTTRDYLDFSLHYMQQVIEGLKKHSSIPKIIFTKLGSNWLESIAQSGCDAVGLDWTIDINQARARIGDQVALQGNMDPQLLIASPERIQQEVATILKAYGHGTGHIFNLGHGITPEIPPEHVAVMVNAVHELSQEYHG
ncbi:MAG: uroporphyrinogen decarboxylase [Proteobacteria bacterium]|nr:uroporphyrinogen decarboxylase [Pseudomonadota bacterium]